MSLAHFQEALLATSKVPATIQRVSQFHEFAGMLVSWFRKEGVVHLPPLLLQPVAISDVAEVLVEVATGAPRGRAVDFVGPEPQDLIDMARRTLEARGESLRLVPIQLPARYRFQFTSGVTALAQGTQPHLSEPYVFRIEQGSGSGGSN